MVNFKKTILTSVVAASMLSATAISSSAATIYANNNGNCNSDGYSNTSWGYGYGSTTSNGTSSSESGISPSGANQASDFKSVGSANIYAIDDGKIKGNGSFGKPYSTKDGELRITTDVGDTPTSTSTKYVNGKKVTVKVYEGTEKSGSFYAEENGELSLIKLVPGDAYKDRVSNGSAA